LQLLETTAVYQWPSRQIGNKRIEIKELEAVMKGTSKSFLKL